MDLFEILSTQILYDSPPRMLINDQGKSTGNHSNHISDACSIAEFTV